MPFDLRTYARGIKLFYQIMKSGGVNLLPSSDFGSLFSNIDPETLKAEYANWVYMCVSRIGDSIAASPLRLWRAKGTDRREWDEVMDHELLDILNAPNPDMDRTSFLQYLSMHEDLSGASYSWLVDVKNDMTIPSMIYPLPPGQVRIKTGKTIPKLIEGFIFRSDVDDKVFDPHEIMYVRRPDPNNIIGGFGPAQGAKDSVTSDNSARRWMQKFFKNNAVPGILFESNTTDPTSNRLLRESFEDRHSGVEKAHRVGVLPPGIKVAAQSSSQKDMEFAELRRMGRDEILAAFGVPPVVLGLGLGESINRATAETQEYVYAKYTIKPKLHRIQAALNKNLTPRFGKGLFLEFDDPVPANVESETKMAESSLGRAPWASINEVRTKMGLPPIDGGETVMGSSLLEPVGAPEQGKAVSFYIHRAMNRADKIDAANQKIADKLTEAIIARVRTASRERKKAIKESTDWEPQWEAFVKRVAPHEKDMRKKMAQYAKGMGERAQAGLKRNMKALDPADLLDPNEEVAAIIQMTGPIYEAILKEEGKSAADLIGEAFDAADERLLEALDRSIALMANSYSEETMRLLKQHLQEGLDQDENLDQLATRIETVTELSEGMRAERVAKTEAFRTANFATREAWKQSGVIKQIKWYTAADEMVCEFCGPQNGQVVGIEEGFFDKDETVEGANGGTLDLNYAAVENPPLHPNCRCYIRPEDVEI